MKAKVVHAQKAIQETFLFTKVQFYHSCSPKPSSSSSFSLVGSSENPKPYAINLSFCNPNLGLRVKDGIGMKLVYFALL